MAFRKKVLPEGWKDPYETLAVVNPDNAKECFAQYDAFMAEYYTLPWRNLEAPSAGESFHESTLQAFKERMESLRAEGLLIPDDVFTQIDKESVEVLVKLKLKSKWTRDIRFGNIFVSIDRCEYASWERGGAGLSLRFGSWLFAIGHLDYRQKNCPWPKWLRFGLSIYGPRNVSMSNRPVHYAYAFGNRVFDTTYWRPRHIQIGR